MTTGEVRCRHQRSGSVRGRMDKRQDPPQNTGGSAVCVYGRCELVLLKAQGVQTRPSVAASTRDIL